jgi:hypothetical protein
VQASKSSPPATAPRRRPTSPAPRKWSGEDH